MKKQILSDAIIAWMRYKRNVIKVPAYCTPEIEGYIKRWSYEKLKEVVKGIYITITLFHSQSCPFCAAYRGSFGVICDDCEFGKINGKCTGDGGNLWSKHELYCIGATPANRKRFDSIFKKLKVEI